jgi:hypothetical protein
MPVKPAPTTRATRNVQVSPLQVASAAAVLSNHGILPNPRIALAVNTLQEEWVILPALNGPIEAIQPSAADEAAQSNVATGEAYWEYIGQAVQDRTVVTWFLGGTLPDWQGTPLALAVLLEENNTFLAQFIGQELLRQAINP